MVLVSLTLLVAAQVPNLFVIAPRFLGEAHFDRREIGWVMGSFNLAQLVGLVACRGLIVRLGHRRIIAGGALIAAAGALAFSLADGLTGFVVGRVLQGLGFSVIVAGAAAYVAEIAPEGRLGEALGVSGVMTLVSQAVGPALAELIHDLAGWTWVWRASVGFGVVAAAVAIRLPIAGVRPPDPPGGRGATMVPMLATVLAGIGFGSIWMFLADYGPTVGVARVTLFFVGYVIAAVAVRLWFGTLSDRIGRRAASAPTLLGHALVLLALANLSARWQLAAVGLGYGLCHGVYYPTLQALVVERSGGDRSRAVVWANFAFVVGIVVAAFALGPVARAWGYPLIYVLAAGCGAIAAALIAWRG
jgi:MFS family permease